MSKKEERLFVLEGDLATQPFQEHILNTRFDIAKKLKNRCKYVLEQNMFAMKKDEHYLFWIKQPSSSKRSEMLKDIRESYDLSKEGAERVIKSMAKEYQRQASFGKRPKRKNKIILEDGTIQYTRKKRKKKETNQPHIDSASAQALSTDVWESLESVLFGNGKNVHYKKFGQVNTIRSKSNNAGIRYRNGVVEWNGLNIPVAWDKKDVYAQKALHHKISFCRIVRKAVRGKYKFYVQLVLKGIPPQKHKRGKGKVGLDNGISTVGIVSEQQVKLAEFCEGLDELYKEKRILQRKLERSRRATNPNNYEENGTPKKGKQKWVRSKNYLKTLFLLKEIYRKIQVKREISHNQLANEVLSMGDDVYTEDMSYKGMRKGWFGKKISEKAPASFLQIINRKLGYDGKKLKKINTWKVKASQYDPYSDSYKKKPLKERHHVTGDGYTIQRDCFSAFLIQHVQDDLETINRTLCLNHFKTFYEQYQQAMKELKATKKSLPKSMGL